MEPLILDASYQCYTVGCSSTVYLGETHSTRVCAIAFIPALLPSQHSQGWARLQSAQGSLFRVAWDAVEVAGHCCLAFEQHGTVRTAL
jgi:hypothetical protein